MPRDRFTNFYGSQIAQGQIWGEQCSINRVGASSLSLSPDYTIQDQTPHPVAYYKFYIESTSDKYAMVNAPDVEWYTYKGKRLPAQPGDIMIPTHNGVMNYRSTTPITTVVSILPAGEILGIKTNRIGSICSGNDLLFSNIRFEYLPRSAFPGTPLDRELEASLGVPSIQVVTYAKPTLWTNYSDAEGLFLYQTDTTPNIIWQITNVTTLTNIYIFDLKRNAIG